MSLHNLWITQTVTNKQKACKKFEKLRQICHTCLWKLINYDEAVLVYLCSLTLCFFSKFVSRADNSKCYRWSEYSSKDKMLSAKFLKFSTFKPGHFSAREALDDMCYYHFVMGSYYGPHHQNGVCTYLLWSSIFVYCSIKCTFNFLWECVY